MSYSIKEIKTTLIFYADKVERGIELCDGDIRKLDDTLSYVAWGASDFIVARSLKGKIEKYILSLTKLFGHPSAFFHYGSLVRIAERFMIKDMEVFLFNVILTTDDNWLRNRTQIALRGIKKNDATKS